MLSKDTVDLTMEKAFVFKRNYHWL